MNRGLRVTVDALRQMLPVTLPITLDGPISAPIKTDSPPTAFPIFLKFCIYTGYTCRLTLIVHSLVCKPTNPNVDPQFIIDHIINLFCLDLWSTCTGLGVCHFLPNCKSESEVSAFMSDFFGVLVKDVNQTNPST